MNVYVLYTDFKFLILLIILVTRKQTLFGYAAYHQSNSDSSKEALGIHQDCNKNAQVQFLGNFIYSKQYRENLFKKIFLFIK